MLALGRCADVLRHIDATLVKQGHIPVTAVGICWNIPYPTSMNIRSEHFAGCGVPKVKVVQGVPYRHAELGAHRPRAYPTVWARSWL